MKKGKLIRMSDETRNKLETIKKMTKMSETAITETAIEKFLETLEKNGYNIENIKS